jgi:outer membrane protein
LDSIFNTIVPYICGDTIQKRAANHPLLTWHQRKIDESEQSEKYMHSQKMPTVNIVGVIQGRGSGFDWNYIQDQTAYSSSYFKGTGIQRSNFLIGGTLSWNLTISFVMRVKLKNNNFRPNL